MANHGGVKTRKIITPEAISSILCELNHKYLKGNLCVEYSDCRNVQGSWGPHVWILKYVSSGKEWMSRVCWLNNSRSFEMRHGGGTNFAWWVDALVLNEVAIRYGASKVWDDGVGSIPAVKGKYDSFKEYQDRTYGSFKSDPAEIKALILA